MGADVEGLRLLGIVGAVGVVIGKVLVNPLTPR